MWWWMSLAMAGVGDCAAEHGDAPELWSCVMDTARGGELEEALAFAASRHDGSMSPQGLLTYGNLRMMAREDGVAELYSAAADGFAARGDAMGEVKTRLNLATELRHTGHVDEGRAQLELAAEVAGEAEPLASMVGIEQARWVCDLGGDYAAALDSVAARRPRLDDPDFPPHGKVLIHHVSACLTDRLGLPEATRDHRRALIELAESVGNELLAVVTLDNMLWTEADSGRHRPQLPARVAAAAERARALGHPPTRVDLACLQVHLDPSAPTAPCFEAASDLDPGPIRTRALLLAADRAATPDEAARRLAEAHADIDRSGVWEDRIAALRTEARHAPGPAAIELGERALQAVEALRDHQRDEVVSARVFSAWADVFSEQARRLVDADRPEDAVSVVERMRSRELVERLDAVAATPNLSPSTEQWRRRDALLAQIAALRVDGDDGTLDTLLAEEAQLREAILAAEPAFARLRSTQTDLGAVRDALADNEALILPVLASQPFALVLRRDALEVIELPRAGEVLDRVDVLASLLYQGDPLAERALDDLRDALTEPLRPALDGIEHAVLLPPGPLYRVPWQSLLSPTLSYAPSLRQWVYLRHLALPAGEAVLLGDPSPGPPGAERSDRGALPGARQEARDIARRLGAPQRLLLGEEANKAALFDALRGPVRLLHLASHAEIDGERPRRSAVLLAGDDRWTAADIAESSLDGAIVVLAACEGAEGEALQHGVLGLSDALLQAGARTVIASLHPVSDSAMGQAMPALYDELVAGVRADEAVRRVARTQPVARSLRVLGDGSARLGAPPSRSRWPLFAGLLVLGGLMAGAGWWRTRGSA